MGQKKSKETKVITKEIDLSAFDWIILFFFNCTPIQFSEMEPPPFEFSNTKLIFHT